MFPTSSARRVARLVAARVAAGAIARVTAASAACAAFALSAPRAARPADRLAPRGAQLRTQARTLLATLSAATLLAACSMPTHPDDKAPPPDPFNPAATQLLDDTSWDLTGWKQANGMPRGVPSGITLTLSTASGQRHASGFSGCNRYMGTYELKDGKLSFGPLASTRMACSTPGGERDGAYLDALAHIDRTGVQMRAPQEMQLILEDGDTLTFARHAQ
jgi:heat shock protein HslJ